MLRDMRVVDEMGGACVDADVHGAVLTLQSTPGPGLRFATAAMALFGILLICAAIVRAQGGTVLALGLGILFTMAGVWWGGLTITRRFDRDRETLEETRRWMGRVVSEKKRKLGGHVELRIVKPAGRQTAWEVQLVSDQLQHWLAATTTEQAANRLADVVRAHLRGEKIA